VATVVSIVGTFLSAGRVVGETAENYAHVPAVYRPHSSLTGQVVTGDGHVTGGLAGTLFGTPTVTVHTTQLVTVGGVGSAQAFGVPQVALRFGPGYVPSAQAFGAIALHTTITVSVTGLPSAQVFGTTETGFEVFHVWLREVVCLEPPGSITGEVTCGDGHLTGFNNNLIAPEECLNFLVAILNEFLCGDGTLVGEGRVLHPVSPPLVLDLQPAGCS